MHNFTKSIDRKICSLENHEGNHHIIQKFKSPPWYHLARTVGGVLHIRAGSSDGAQENLSCRISELYFHIEIKTMSQSEEHKLMFVHRINLV